MERLCIVTGGANGIGAGIVRRLHTDGYQVLFCDIDRQQGETLKSEFSDKPRNPWFLHCDVRNPADVARVIAYATETRVPLFALINNAGIFPRRDILEITLDEWNDVIATNLTGPFIMSQKAAPLMIAHGMGVIVNIASGQSFRGDALGVHYTSTKHGIRGLTKSLALALGPRGIRVNAIAPGPTLTAQALQARSKEDLLERGHQLPLGRIGQPQDVAGAVSFLLSSDGEYITGQTILVNGGADMP